MITPSDPKARELKSKAVDAKMKLLTGKLTYEEAVSKVKPYIDFVNKKAAETAKKYGMKARKISINGFLR